MGQIKFSIFADLHYFPEAFYDDASERLSKMQQKALDNNVDCIISLGDFCHKPTDSIEIIEQFNDFSIPAYHVLGNHDTDYSLTKDTLELYRMPGCYYYFDLNEFRFVVLDTNYVKINGEFQHYELGNYYSYPDSRDYMHPEELCWLRSTILSSPYPCILLSHASFERESRTAVINRDEVISIIREANSLKANQVIMAINGHYHRDFLRILEGVAYLDLNSASFDWINTPHAFYPEKLCSKHEYMANTIIFNEPLHAVITVDTSGLIDIQGMTGAFFMDITREMTDNPKCDNAGRPCTSSVLSARFQMKK